MTSKRRAGGSWSRRLMPGRTKGVTLQRKSHQIAAGSSTSHWVAQCTSHQPPASHIRPFANSTALPAAASFRRSNINKHPDFTSPSTAHRPPRPRPAHLLTNSIPRGKSIGLFRGRHSTQIRGRDCGSRYASKLSRPRLQVLWRKASDNNITSPQPASATPKQEAGIAHLRSHLYTNACHVDPDQVDAYQASACHRQPRHLETSSIERDYEAAKGN